MTRRLLPPGRLAAFTIIELLTVIAIILILAGLLLNIAGSAQYKASMSRATTEIKAIETALEGYKADNGIYPRVLPSSMSGGTGGTSYSDSLNAQSDTDPGGSAKAKYQGASETLYQALSGITAFSGTTPTYGGKRYMEFKPGQLSDATSGTYTTPLATTMLVDPFGYIYGYSTANTWAVEQSQNGITTDATKYGYNPTIDLWCTGGYSPTGGKTYTSKSITVPQSVWAKNW